MWKSLYSPNVILQKLKEKLARPEALYLTPLLFNTTLTSMKKNIIFTAFCMFLILACTNKKTAESTDNQLDATQIEEVKTLEKETIELENLDVEIEKKAKELEDLLEEIDK